MACKFISNIKCSDSSNCAKCGWNPEVRTRRLRKIKEDRTEQTQLSRRLREYKETVSSDCFKILATQIGGRVTSNILQNIANGFMPWLHPNELKRIDDALRKIEGQEDGKQVS